MSEVDFERASLLMHIIEKIATVTPSSTALLGEAHNELAEINAGAYAAQQARAEERRQEEAARAEAEALALKEGEEEEGEEEEEEDDADA